MLVGFFLSFAALTGKASAPVLPYTLQDSRETEFKLPNGLKVYLLPYPGASLTAVTLAVRAGVVDESPETNGFLHLLEHCLLFRQSHLTRDDRLFSTINQLGLYYNAYTQQDLMLFVICLPTEHLYKGLELLKEVVYYFNLNEEELEKEKTVLLKELAEISRQPEKVGPSGVYALSFPGTGYALPVYGSAEVIKQVSLTDLRDWHQKYFRVNNSALAVVGNFQSEELKANLDIIFSDLKPGSEAISRSAIQIKFPASSPLIELRMKVSDTYVMAGLMAPEYNNPDRVPMEMLAEIAGQGLNPLIYRAFAGQPDLISSARFHYLIHEQAGLIFMSITTEEKKVPAVKRKLQNFLPRLAEMNYSRNDYLPGEQLLVFNFLRGGKNRIHWMSEKMIESPLILSMSLARHLLLRDEKRSENYLEAINKLDSSDLRKIARKYLAKPKPVWVVIRPE